MLIKVCTLTGKIIEIDIEHWSTVERIKERIQESEGMDPKYQKLLYNGGRELSGNTRTAKDYGLEEGSFIHLGNSMRLLFFFTMFVVVSSQPISLFPTNPHYFLWKGTPKVLITSTEHYGAVMNLDFNYIKYLDTLQSLNFSLTRTFTGAAYREYTGYDNMINNTLNPLPGRYLAPWALSRECCYYDKVLNKFDLSQWNQSYWDRLTDFVAQAARRNIIVNLGIYCVFYDDLTWGYSPLNGSNNINNVGMNATRFSVNNLQHPEITTIQQKFVQKLVTVLNDFDNLFYEVVNEPYIAPYASAEFQAFVAATIVETEHDLPKKHLIAQGIANFQQKIVATPNGNISIFNFHYTYPANVLLNYALDQPIADDETGFNGPEDKPYRQQGWSYILGGGSTYDNLDYSYTAGHEDGSAGMGLGPGSGSPTLRQSLSVLNNFIHQFDFTKMAPNNSVVQDAPPNLNATVLAESGVQYGIYFFGLNQTTCSLDLPYGKYIGTWVDPQTGKILQLDSLSPPAANGGIVKIQSPTYTAGDIAYKVMVDSR